VLVGFNGLPVLQFDPSTAAELDSLRSKKIRIGEMDLRLAASALSRNLVVVTRNSSDFSKVPGLRIEDWTR